MRQIRVYDITFAPEMKPADSEIGSDYRRVSTILYTLGARGADARYLNLHRDALLFMDNPVVQQIMKGPGMDGFPCMTADDKIVVTGRYPTNEEILEQLDADMMELLARPVSGCSGVCSNCHVEGCGPAQ